MISGILLGFAPSASLAGQNEWVTDVFPQRAYDFGNVARGSRLRHTFALVNKTGSEIHIADSHTKCGCTDVRIGARTIPPGTQTTIEATIDTTKFQGHKASGLSLVLDRPSYVVVDLNLTCFIRGDITMNPGQIDFGVIRQSAKSPTAALTLLYAGGRPDWAIVKMNTQTARIKARGEELTRSAGGQTQWNVSATLEPGQSLGYFKDEITLITNDTPPQTIPISVVANIQSAVTVTPSILNFGQVKAGQTITRDNVIHVRSASPFSITKLSAERSEAEPKEVTTGAITDHAVSLTLKAPTNAGPFHTILTIESDLRDEPPSKVKIFATIVP
jgi:hypothetical protein